MAMGEALVGTDKPILVTTGLAMLAPGRVALESDMPPFRALAHANSPVGYPPGRACSPIWRSKPTSPDELSP